MHKAFFPALLVFAAILLSGCTVPQAQAPEQEAIALADQTEEGRLIAAMNQGFGKIQDCTVDEFEATVGAFRAAMGGSQQPALTDDEKAMLASAIEGAEQCALTIEKAASKISENKYLVSYKYAWPQSCQNPPFMVTGAESFVDVEVDTEAGTATVVKGKLGPEQLQEGWASVQGGGNCFLALLINPAVLAPAQYG